MRLLRNPPSHSLQDSYLQQGYRFLFEGAELLLCPLDGRPDGLRPAQWQGGPIHFMSAWSPHGAAGTFAKFAALQRRLMAKLTQRSLRVEAATALASSGGWFEAQVMVWGLSDAEAVSMAHDFGQGAAVGWHNDTVTVLPTGLQQVGQASIAVNLSRLPSRTCPVRSDFDPHGRCVTHGGSFGSAAIHAGAQWQQHRAAGLALIGCDSCDDGRESCWGAGGTAMSLSDVRLASRYGNATWEP